MRLLISIEQEGKDGGFQIKNTEFLKQTEVGNIC